MGETLMVSGGAVNLGAPLRNIDTRAKPYRSARSVSPAPAHQIDTRFLGATAAMQPPNRSSNRLDQARILLMQGFGMLQINQLRLRSQTILNCVFIQHMRTS